MSRAARAGAHLRVRSRLLRQYAIWCLLAGAGIVALIYAVPPRTACSTVGCSVLTGLFSTLASLLIGAAAFVLLVRARLLSAYLRIARAHPGRLLTGVAEPDADVVLDRPALYAALESELRSPASGVIVVAGDAGAGKSTLVRGFTRELARRGWVPVPIAVRGETLPLDFDALARRRFLMTIDRKLGVESQGDRVWRQLVRHRMIVVLADGLDELLTRGGVLDEAELGSASLPVVATSRPDVLSGRLRRGAYELPPLANDPLVDYIGGATLDGGTLRELAQPLVLCADIASEPFYLSFARALLRTRDQGTRMRLAGICGPGAETGSVDEVRAGLLEAWFDALKRGLVERQSDVAEDERADALDLASYAAAVSYRAAARDGDVDCVLTCVAELPGASDPRELDYRRTLLSAGRLKLVSETADGRLQFPHPIMRAALAARVLALPAEDGTTPMWRCVAEDLLNSESLRALRIAVAAGYIDASAVAIKLLARARAHRRPGARLDIAGTAAEIAVRAPPPVGQAAIAGVCRGYAAARVPSRLRALDALATLGSPAAFRALWDLGREGAYAETWRVVERVTERPRESYEAVRSKLDGMMGDAEAWEPPETEFPELPPALKKPCSAMAKFLPALTEQLLADDSPHADEASQLLGRLARLVEQWRPRNIGLGLEASLAQGFKHASWQHTRGDHDDDVASLSTHGTFWYARAMAVQALGLRAARVGVDSPRHAPLHAALDGAMADEHRFVAVAARLCARGVDRGAIGEFVWEDESTVIARSGHELDPQAARLLGEIVLVLNMNEQLDPADPTRLQKTQLLVGTSDRLPACLTDGRAHDRLLADERDPCDDTVCGFHLCPYRPELTDHRATAFRGNPSAAFCRRQQYSLAGSAVLRRFGRVPLSAVWRELEQRYG